jgi:hypothetical protein
MLKLRELLARLTDAGVEYVIVGGIAARLNGSTLPTEDLDVCCRMTPENMARFIAAIGDLNPVSRGDPRKIPMPRDPHVLATYNTLLMNTDLGILDLLREITGVGDFDAVLRESVVMEVEGRPTRALNLDALIASKRALGHEKDKLALHYLEAAKQRRERDSRK